MYGRVFYVSKCFTIQSDHVILKLGAFVNKFAMFMFSISYVTASDNVLVFKKIKDFFLDSCMFAWICYHGLVKSHQSFLVYLIISDVRDILNILRFCLLQIVLNLRENGLANMNWGIHLNLYLFYVLLGTQLNSSEQNYICKCIFLMIFLSNILRWLIVWK